MKELKENMRKDYEQYLKNGYCTGAKELNGRIGEDYFDVTNPHYFTGKLDAEVVVINLNPKRDINQQGQKVQFDDFEKYWEHYTKFGIINYDPENKSQHKSAFDQKQVRFFKAIGLLDLLDNSNNKRKNLQRVVDNKLQWELVPYGSSDFKFQKVGRKNLLPFIEKAVKVVSMYPRKYILFNGAIFRELLKLDNVQEVSRYNFSLTKTDGSQTKGEFYEVINICIKSDNTEIRACILPHYAVQGLPIESYAKKTIEFYHK